MGYEYERNGRTYYVGTEGRTFETLAARDQYEADRQVYGATIRQHVEVDRAGNWLIPMAMDRAEYERRLAAIPGATTWTDQEVEHNEYGILYYQPQHGLNYAEAIKALELRFAGCRLWGIRVDRGLYTPVIDTDGQMRSLQPVPQPTPAPSEQAACSLCGLSVSRTMLMTSPRGPVCPDCYDEAES